MVSVSEFFATYVPTRRESTHSVTQPTRLKHRVRAMAIQWRGIEWWRGYACRLRHAHRNLPGYRTQSKASRNCFSMTRWRVDRTEPPIKVRASSRGSPLTRIPKLEGQPA